MPFLTANRGHSVFVSAVARNKGLLTAWQEPQSALRSEPTIPSFCEASTSTRSMTNMTFIDGQEALEMQSVPRLKFPL